MTKEEFAQAAAEAGVSLEEAIEAKEGIMRVMRDVNMVGHSWGDINARTVTFGLLAATLDGNQRIGVPFEMFRQMVLAWLDDAAPKFYSLLEKWERERRDKVDRADPGDDVS